MTGVFVEPSAPPRKIASIGVGLRGWISYHGFALNVVPDAEAFAGIVPCGLHGVVMTSVAREQGRAEAGDALFSQVRDVVADSARCQLARRAAIG
jgi:lipoate-protein ligase B